MRLLSRSHFRLLPQESSLSLYAYPFSPPWNFPSFSVELTLSTPCTHSVPPLSRPVAAFARLNSLSSHDLVIWTDGSFLLSKAAPASLPTAHFVALRPLFPIRQAQYVQAFPLKRAPFR